MAKLAASSVTLDPEKNAYIYNGTPVARVSTLLKALYPTTFVGAIVPGSHIARAIEAGTAMHARIADAITADPALFLDKLLPHEDRHFISYHRHKLAACVLVASEYAEVSCKYLYAGTFDALFYDPATTSYILIDWKRSKQLTPQTLRYYSAQLNLYRQSLLEQHAIHVHSMRIILLHPDLDHPVEIEVEPAEDSFWRKIAPHPK